jgi:Ca2+-transporting ATPase
VVAIDLATELGLFQRLLGTVSLTLEQWVVCTVLGLSILVVSEIKKRLWRVDLDAADDASRQPAAAAPAA